MKKNIKIGLKFLGYIISSIVILFLILVIFMLLITPSYPSGSSKMNDNICVNFSANMGSMESIIVSSYYCNSEPDWNVLNGRISLLGEENSSKYYKDKEFRDKLDKENESKVLDKYFSMECPSIKVKNNLVKIKQKRICKEFAHSSFPDKYTHVEIEVDENGKFNFIKGGSEF